MPLEVNLYSSSKDILPKPFSDNAKIYLPSSDVVKETTLVSSSISIPLTPVADLPMTLTSVSLNLTIFPLSADKEIKASPLVSLTFTNSSPSRITIAFLPLWRIESNSNKAVLFTTPSLVAKNKNWF